MKLFLKIFAILLLLFNGIGAIYGGWSFIIRPDGSGLQMSLDWLQNTPFRDFFIPGIVLFIANGLGSMLVLSLLLMRHRYSAWLVMGEGAILTGWIIIQMLLIQTVHPLHIIMGSVGLLLLGTGWGLRKTNATILPN